MTGEAIGGSYGEDCVCDCPIDEINVDTGCCKGKNHPPCDCPNEYEGEE